MEQLLQAFLLSPTRGKLLQTRLCLTVVTFIIHAVPTHWSGAIPDLFHRVREVSPKIGQSEAHRLLLEFLTMIPEQLERSILSKRQLSGVTRDLMESKATVLSYLGDILAQPPTELTPLALKCLAVWAEQLISLPEAMPFAPMAVSLVRSWPSISWSGS